MEGKWKTFYTPRSGRDPWTRKNAKIIVLGGIHGYKDGRLGPIDEGLLEDNLGQVNLLKRNFEKELNENNISIVLVDVGQHMDRSELNSEKMIDAVKSHNPTIIILAFC